MLYSEIKEREHRFFLSLKIAIPFVFFLLFIFLIVTTNINIKSLLKNNIVAFLAIFFIYVYYILYQIYMGFKTSMIDNVTKAFSREYITKIINEKLYDKKFLIIAIKISNILDINERYGIKRTDKVLKYFVKEINDFLILKGYKDICIGHILGGDFIFLLDESEKKTEHILKQLINKINQKQNIYLNLIYSYISSEMENTADDLLVILFDQLKLNSLNRRKNRRLNVRVDEFERLIIKLIKEREFDIKFQPIFNLKKNKIIIYEVLIKLKSKKYGKISQREFTSIINRLEYEIIFDEIVIEEIFKISSNFKNDMNFSIEISFNSLRNNNFLKNIKKMVEIYSIKPENIIFEINSNSYLQDNIKLNENINIFKNMGFRIGLNNFGGDFTSFGYLKYLNFDIVKFDIEYSKKYTNERFRDILKSFIMIFKDLDIKTVAKFIEDEKSYDFFKDIGVDCIQGYIIKKPVSLEKLRSEV